ncbi:MerR family transcriptional regulator [Paenibacillus sp. M1]|uniref:MerR family transcriptional regulator n=1 Tax=Paenibacillus haidiansis TaxID=1574488 RepID=A0ABU7VUT4_9BACL
MKYCIGEFSAILGITRDTLRLYEKHDIVTPVKDDFNSYRYFNDLDARDLLMSRWYRSLQIPLQEVADLMKHSSLDKITEKIDASRNNLEEEIKRGLVTLNKMVEIKSELDNLETSMYQCVLKHRPGLYRLKQTENNRLLKNEGLKGMVNTWMELLPFSFFCFRVEQSELSSGNKNAWDYSWGLTLTDVDAKRLDVELNDLVEYIPPAACISSVIRVPHQENITKRTLQFMFDYLEAAGYRVTGDIVGRIILTEKAETESRSYLEVNISV